MYISPQSVTQHTTNTFDYNSDLTQLSAQRRSGENVLLVSRIMLLFETQTLQSVTYTFLSTLKHFIHILVDKNVYEVFECRSSGMESHRFERGEQRFDENLISSFPTFRFQKMAGSTEFEAGCEADCKADCKADCELNAKFSRIKIDDELLNNFLETHLKNIYLQKRDCALKSLVKRLCGDVQRVVPFALSKKDSGDKYRDPTEYAGDYEKDFSYLDIGLIGGHAQIDIGLSGAFFFFIMRECTIGTWQPKYSNSNTHPARLEGSIIVGKNKDLLNKALDLLNKALVATEQAQGVKFAYRSSTRKLLVTFKNQSKQNCHSDSNTEGGVNECRILWDFHPRGRILSMYTQQSGLFLESCGVEFCSQIMCGRSEVPGIEHVDTAARKLQHQGYDCDPLRASGCALVTALFDLEMVGSTGDHIQTTIQAVNSDAFQKNLQAGMTKYVNEKITLLKRKGNNLESLEKLQIEQNRELYDAWISGFNDKACDLGDDSDLYLDAKTNAFIRKSFLTC